MRPPPRRCIKEGAMKLEGGCYCGQVRYVAEGDPMLKAQCHCRECQYISGGSPNMFVLMPPAGFGYTKGTPRQFTRSESRRRRDAGILRRMRHAYAYAPAGVVRGESKSRHARRSRPVWQPADGDFYHRQAGFPSYPGRHAGLRAIAETIAARETQHLVVPAKRANGSRQRAPDGLRER